MMHSQDQQDKWVKETYDNSRDQIQPPEHLDIVILAAAEKSCVQKNNARSRPLVLRREWQCLFAFAASILIIVNIYFFYDDTLYPNKNVRIDFDSKPSSPKPSMNNQSDNKAFAPITVMEMEENINLGGIRTENTINNHQLPSSDNDHKISGDNRKEQQLAPPKPPRNNKALNSNPPALATTNDQVSPKKSRQASKELPIQQDSKSDSTYSGQILSDNEVKKISDARITKFERFIYPDKNNKIAWHSLYQQLMKEGDQEKIQVFIEKFKTTFPNENPELFFKGTSKN